MSGAAAAAATPTVNDGAAQAAAGAQPGAQPGEQKPAEQKPAEQKPAEQKPAEQKPAEQKPAEQQPAEQKPAEQKPGEVKPGEQQQPPAKYELKLPENTALEQADVDAITEMAKARGLTNDQAQAALAEMHDALEAQRTRLLSELQGHKEIGGTNLEAAQRDAQRAVDRFLPADSDEGKRFRSDMAKSGYGNYAPIVLLLSRIGKAMGEDRPPKPGAGESQTGKKSHADVLFGDAKK